MEEHQSAFEQKENFPEVIFEEIHSSYNNLPEETKNLRILANEYLDIVEKTEEKEGLNVIYWGLGALIAGGLAWSFIPLNSDKTIVAFLGFTLVIGNILSKVFSKFIKF